MVQQEGPLSEDFFLNILESNKEEVRSTVRNALLDGVKKQFEWELPQAVRTAVAEFITEEIIPEIKAELEANKNAIVDAATEMVRGAPVEIGKAMQAKVAESLTHSYNLRKMMEAIL